MTGCGAVQYAQGGLLEKKAQSPDMHLGNYFAVVCIKGASPHARGTLRISTVNSARPCLMSSEHAGHFYFDARINGAVCHSPKDVHACLLTACATQAS